MITTLDSPLRSSLALALCVVGLASRAPAAQDVCKATTKAALDGCRGEARAARSIAAGKCGNLADAAARRSCIGQVAATLKDESTSCAEQRTARLSACGALGAAPYHPTLDPAKFTTTINNPLFPLIPGTTFVYEGQTEAGLSRTDFVVTHNTKVINGITCVEVHDTVHLNGVLEEDTLDWFAQDTDGNVWYFGESTFELIDGRPATLEGSFKSGIDGAQAGIIMKAHPAIGDAYRQEFDLANAEDNAKVISLTDAITVPYGSFSNCVTIEETTPLEPDALEHKLYAAGVGNVATIKMDTTPPTREELISVTVE